MKKLILLCCIFVASISSAQMTTVGSANPMGGCNTYQLCPPAFNVSGAIWTQTPINLTSNFDMTFQVYFGNDGVWGADGMGFVLQSGSTGIGGIGNAMGFATPFGFPAISANQVAIELDVFDNGGAVPSDVADDHIGISSGGSTAHNLAGPTLFPGAQIITDGAWHTFRVQWNAGLQTLAAYWQGNPIPLITVTNDIVTNFFGGNPNVYWGFTSGTGGLYNETRVRVVSSPAFSSSVASVCPGIPVNFTDLTTSPIGSPVSWSWDFGDGSPLDNNQNPSHSFSAPGVYNVALTVSDGFCDTLVTANITVLDSITMNMSSVPVTCFGDTDGTSTSTPTNGTGPYTYGWDDIGTQATQTATSLPPGWYTVMVTDNLGCVGFDSVEVLEPLAITLAMDSTDASCNGGTDGTASTVPTNGTGPYGYLWDDLGAQTTATATGLPAGTYSVVVTDVNGCTANGSVEVVEALGLSVNMDSIVVTCFGGSDGAAIVNVTSGVGPFIYLWDDTGAQNTDTASGLPAGTYTVTVTDGGACSITESVVVTQPVAVSATISAVPVDCFGNSSGTATVTVNTGVSPYTYLWDDAGTQTTVTAIGLPVGTYNVTVTDADGCTTSNSISVTEPTALTGSSTSSDDFGGGIGAVDITVSGGSIPYSYAWSNGATTEDITGLTQGTYDVIITDNSGCTLTLSGIVNEILDLELPSGMSPNGDGLNDSFRIIGIEAYQQNSLIVTNRWGNVVYKIEDYANDWNGLNMDGEELPEGVYFVIFETSTGEQFSTYLELRRL